MWIKIKMECGHGPKQKLGKFNWQTLKENRVNPL